MKRLILCLCILWAVLGNSLCFAFDWKSLHERADKTDLFTALSRVDKDPGSLEDLYVLGLKYLDLYETGKAQQVFDKLAALTPSMAESLWGRAEVLRRYHRLDESEEILAKINTDHPEFYPAYLTLSYIRFLQLRFRESASLALVVVRVHKQDIDLNNYVRAHLLYAGAKGMMAHYGGPVSRLVNGFAVLPALRKSQAMKPDSPEVLYGFGCYYLLAPRGLGKNLGLALSYLERLVVDDPHFPEGFVRLAQVYKINGDFNKYEQLLGTALELDPQNELALDVKNHTCRYICPEESSH